MTKYQNLWEKDPHRAKEMQVNLNGHFSTLLCGQDRMQKFVQRAMQPLARAQESPKLNKGQGKSRLACRMLMLCQPKVTNMASLESLEKETGHCFVLCAASMTRGFLEVP